MRQFLLASCLLLAGCATSADVPTVLSQPVDSAVQEQAAAVAAQQVVTQLSTGKVKFKGAVTIQLGGTGNTANATNAPRAKAPVAAGPHATATDASKKGGTPWQVFAALGLVCVGVGVWLGTKLGGVTWLAKLRN